MSILNAMTSSLTAVLLFAVLAVIEGKVYERCELAKELRDRYHIPEGDVSKWVCIAQHESNFNTAAVNNQSGDHGIFQISQLWWCSPPGSGTGCGKPCKAFEDDDITDDVACVLHIKELQGFKAWVAYNTYCTGDTASYTKGCF